MDSKLNVDSQSVNDTDLRVTKIITMGDKSYIESEDGTLYPYKPLSNPIPLNTPVCSFCFNPSSDEYHLCTIDDNIFICNHCTEKIVELFISNNIALEFNITKLDYVNEQVQQLVNNVENIQNNLEGMN